METSGQRIRGIRAAAVTDTSRARRGVSPVSLALVFFPFRQSGAPGRLLSSARARRHTCRRQHPPTQKHHGRSYRLHVRHVHRGARQGAWPAGRFPGRKKALRGAGRGETQRAYKRGKTSFQGFGDFRRTAVRPTGRAGTAGGAPASDDRSGVVRHSRKTPETDARRASDSRRVHPRAFVRGISQRAADFHSQKSGRRVLRCGAETRRVILFLFFQRVSPDVWGRIRRRDRCPSRPCSASVVHRDVLRASRGHRAPHASGLSLNTPREDR